MNRSFIAHPKHQLEKSMKIKYSTIDSFQKDIKRLLKKYRTIEEDLKTAKCNALELYHLKSIDNQSIFSDRGILYRRNTNI